MDDKRIEEFVTRNRGAIVGGLIGLVVFLMFVGLGFFKTLLLVAFVVIGVYFGSKRENWERFLRYITNLFPDSRE